MDCKPGFTCDPTTHVCNQCNVDSDCTSAGQICVQHSCTWCATPQQCAGNSCNCCPVGLNGKQMQCLVIGGVACQKDGDCTPGTCNVPAGQTTGQCLPPASSTTCMTDADCGKGTCDTTTNHCLNLPECVECTQDTDCTEGGVCDITIGQCVPSQAAHESGSCCGDGCLQCPASDPLCLPGPFGTACAGCRNDTECQPDNFCIEGECSACIADQRCGPRCQTCTGDTPFCFSEDQVAASAVCVRCTTDAACAGGTCDAKTHTCSDSCPMTCATGTFCDGQTCVGCYADTQCPCNGTCDLTSHTCSTSCKSNVDCLGDQHCQHADDGTGNEFCSPGPLPDNSDCGTTLANICSSGSSVGSRGPHPVPPAGVAALAVLAYVRRRRPRGAS
jgi:Cys-rich repeat protein